MNLTKSMLRVIPISQNEVVIMVNNINSILNNIDSINANTTVAQESVMDSVCNYAQKEFDMMYCEYTMQIESNGVYQEGIGQAIKTGISKIINLIKKGIDFLGRIITGIIDFFKKLFGKEKKSVNNILLDNVLDSNDESSVTESVFNTITDMNLFFIDVEHDKFKLRLNPFEKKKALTYKRSRVDVEQIPTNIDIYVITLLKEPNMLDKFINAIKCFSIDSNGKMVVDPNMKKIYDDFCSTFKNLANSLTLRGETAEKYEFDIKTLQIINKKVSEVRQHMDRLAVSDMSNYDDASGYIDTDGNSIHIAERNANPRYILEFMQQDILNIDMAMNSFLRSVKNVYLVDKHLYGKINSVGKLDKFIYLMMKNGYPSKVIADNIHYTLQDAIPENTSGTGQTRYVVMPKDKDFVYKCAINVSGLSSNKIEEYVYTQYKKYNAEYMLAAVIDIGKYKCVIKQEKCNTKSQISDDEFNEFYNHMNDVCAKNQKLPIVSDRKKSNLGRHKNGDICILDYGIISSFSKAIPTYSKF